MTATIPGTELRDGLAAGSTTELSPSSEARQVSRRTVLSGLLGLGLGTALASPLTQGTAFAAPPRFTPDNPPTPLTLPAPSAPYAMAASSELSDDAFATSDVLIGADDEILPFYNPASQTVEALVFSGGTLHHLHRDVTQATGWAFAGFDLQGIFSSVTDVAVATDTSSNTGRVYALIVGIPDGYGDPTGSPYWLTWLDDATTWDSGFIGPTADPVQYPPSTGQIKGGTSPEGVAYFYSSTVDDNGFPNLLGWITTGDFTNPLDYQPLLTLGTLPSTTTIQDYLVLYDTNSGDTGYAVVLTSDGYLNVYQQNGDTFESGPDSNSGAGPGVTGLLWAWTSFASSTQAPGLAYQGNISGSGAGTFFVDEDGNFAQVGDLPGSGTNVVTVWLQNSQYTVNLLDSNGILQTIQQTAPGAWADPLPLTNGVPGSPQAGLVAVFGVPTDPTRATLFAVGADETLSVLSLDDSGWTQTQIRQDNVVAVQLTCYRLTISVVDNNGSPIQYGQAQLDSDRPVGLWQDIGSTTITPDTPITLTADLHGQITVSVPAEELDVAVLIVQALDPTGQPSGAAAAITADYDVRNFLGGNAALNGVGMSGTTLLSATNPDGTPLFPALDQTGANALVGGLASAITAGIGAAPAATAPRAYRLERHGDSLQLSTSRDPHAFGVAPRGQVELSISHLFDTIGHSLRHAMAKVESAVVRWAEEATQWVVDLTTTISEGATYAINDMKDAFHVIGGWFTTVGADIDNALTWLKREVLGILTGVGENATTIENVLDQAPAGLISIVNGIEKQVDGWFSQQETTVAGWIGDLATAVEEATFGSSQPLTTPSTDTGSSTAVNGLEKDIRWIFKVANDCPGKWLYDKLMQYLPQDPGPNLDGVFDAVVNDLVAAFTDSVELATGIVNTVWDTAKDLTTPGQVSEVEVATFFNDINGLAHDVLTLCDAIADTVLDFIKAGLDILQSYLNYEWSLTSIDPILKLVLDQLGFDPTISLNRLVSLVVAFPVTLVRTVIGDNPVFSPPATARRAGTAGNTADTVSSFFQTCAAISQFVWSGADIVGDLKLLVNEGDTQRPQAPGIIDYFDIICPILENTFLLPGWNGGLIWKGLPTDTNLNGLIAPAVLTEIITPIMKIAQKATPDKPPAVDPNVIPYYSDALVEPSALAQYYGPVVSMVAGVANTVLASIYTAKNSTSTGPTVNSILGTVLGNLSNIGSPLTTWWLNNSLEDVPVAVKVVVDGVGDVGAGITYALA